MADYAELLLRPFEEDDDYENDDGVVDHSETLGELVPFWHSSSSSGFADPSFVPGDLFIPTLSSSGSSTSVDSDGVSDSASDILDGPAGLALNLFDHGPTQPTHECMVPLTEALESNDFRVLDGVEDMGSDYLGLGGGSNQDCSDWGDVNDLFFGQRGSGDSPSPCPFDGEGLRIAGFGSESDSEDEQIVAPADNSEGGGSLRWDRLRIDEEQRRDTDVEFEWEEVDGRLEEREEVFTMMAGVAEYGSDGSGDGDLDDEEELDRHVEWEVLLAVNHLGRNPTVEEPEDAESYFVDFINTSEYDIMVGQIFDQDNSLRGSPPAAKWVVENLPSIVLTEEDVAKNNTLCAVCKDEISLEERAKQLPCLHHYHGDCIFPWLRIRNTCPVCRHELPTDDPGYENRWAQQAGGSGPMEDSHVRYDSEMFPEV